MHNLTTGEMWAGMLVIAGACVFIAAAYCIHLKAIVKDILDEEKRNMREWAYHEAEIRANERVKEILSTVEITIPVELVNESDISWGDRRKEDAA